MARGRRAQSQATPGANVGYEAQLWKMADALREQETEAAKLYAAIDANLKALDYGFRDSDA